MARPSMAAFAQSTHVQGTASLDSRPAEVMPGRMKQVARRRQGAAPAMRAQPTRSGLGAPSLARRLITLPVVPHDTAATQTRASPRSIAPVVYGSEGRVSVETIGFIGLGNMGAPMAGRLLTAGYPLVVHDARASAAEPLRARGARWADTPAAVASAARTIITIVPSSREVRLVFEGPEGLLSALTSGSLCIEMTTADPSATRELAPKVEGRGAHLIDAPVSGGVRGATEGTLAIMVGGPAALVDQARPVLERMGKHIFHAGPVGTGHAIKLVNNMCSAGILALTIEAVAVAAKAGGAPARAVEIIQASSGRSNASDYKFPQFILNGAFDAGFAIRLMLKDVDGYARLAQEGGVPSMMGRVASEVYRMAVARGMAELDHTAVARLIEEWAGIELRSKPGDPA